MVLLKTLLFTAVVPGTVTVLIPWLLLGRGSSATFPSGIGDPRLLGTVPIALGALVYAWCAWEFAAKGRGTPAPIDPPRFLVVRGFYRFVRNPMYVGVCLVLFGEALLFASAALLAYAACVLLAFHLMVVLYEEPTLRRTFGASYARYCEEVPRWVPRIRR